MRNISFSATIEQFKASQIDAQKGKDTTRRMWKELWVEAGDYMMGVEKAQGLKKGEKIKQLGAVCILSVQWEQVDDIIRRPIRNDQPWAITPRTEMEREGFPDMTAVDFVDFFCRLNKCDPDRRIARVVFRHSVAIQKGGKHAKTRT